MKVYQKPEAIAIARASHYHCFSCDRWYRMLRQSLPECADSSDPRGHEHPGYTYISALSVTACPAAVAASSQGLPTDLSA